jgi:class 3 adenylate cyclase/tetratricopeptide (TPR) repeat protein
MGNCLACGGDNRADARFCGSCGASLSVTCGACAAANEPDRRFCYQCGTSLAQAAAVGSQPSAAERRFVSVLFVDLVGFTTASETRDSEDTRELLTKYFETARRTIERYGGTIEKFIGDAVMAVWGAPVAQEDDAERAVRAALDLVSLVPSLDANLRARAGVLSGEAAVTIGAEGQGLVAGDLVNTSSRIQSAAEPGTVLVGESTKRASEASVAYDDAGEHTLKGKSEPVRLWRALRIVAGAKGAQRVAGLEAPFVGRDRELRLVKDLFHASADERRAQLSLITGVAGIGKSRLAWEFEKYVDGLAGDAFWHRGRCLSYGDGVAYWALAEMVRMRCDIVEDEEPAAARDKLAATLAAHLPDEDERLWVEPRLAHLLGLEEGVTGDQENLFSAWRILFERLAETAPTILLFEDVQWADTGLLDFLEYLLDWARSHPIFVVALARPEFAQKRPGWGGGMRSFSSTYLQPLPQEAMDDLLTGLVPGLPDDLRARILDRAQGIPLYAVETVRMLLDRGLVEPAGNVYRTTGPVETLDVPETLHALVAARLDSLTPAERGAVGAGAVLGKTFTRQGLSVVMGEDETSLDVILAQLLRKEILSVQADPRSPERGQYSFLQDIVKRVAYDTLSKRDRKAKHVAAARYLSSVWASEEDEIVEVVAAHLLDAYRAAPDDPDAPELRDTAREMLVRAADRAASLGANVEAQRAFERACDLTDDEVTEAALRERAGTMAYAGGRADEAASNFERSMELFESTGQTHAAARVSSRLAEISWDRGRLEQGLEAMDRAYALLADEEPDADLAALAAQIGRFMFFAGHLDIAFERTERALELAEAFSLPETMSQALNTKGVLLNAAGRMTEGSALVAIALEIALEHDKPSAALRAYFNLADTSARGERMQDAADLLRRAVAFARRVGNRYWEWNLLGATYSLYASGDWDEALEFEEGLPSEDWERVRLAFYSLATSCIPIRVHQGQVQEAKDRAQPLIDSVGSADVQEFAQVHFVKALFAFTEGRYAEALESAEAAMETRESVGIQCEAVKEAAVLVGEAALALGDEAKVDELLELIDTLLPGSAPRFLQAHAARFRARRATGDEADPLFKQAVRSFRELAFPFYLGVSLLEYGEWLVAQGRSRDAEPMIGEAGTIFERLGAVPWVERSLQILPRLAEAAS